MQTAARAQGMSRSVAAPARPRDIRLDLFRGLALLLIAVTHMGGNWLVELMPSHFGFSSPTEMFVFCSGVASGLAFGAVFLKRGFLMGTLRVVHRIWQIYWAHIATFVAVIAMTIVLASSLGRPGYFAALQQDVLLTHPRQGLLGLVTLTYLPPLFDILPLYIVLLAMIPVVMAARRLAKTLPFILVGGIYVYVWTAGITLPANPTDLLPALAVQPLWLAARFFHRLLHCHGVDPGSGPRNALGGLDGGYRPARVSTLELARSV